MPIAEDARDFRLSKMFTVIIGGITVGYVKEFDLPEMGLTVSLFGGAGSNYKKPVHGHLEVGQWTLKKAIPSETGDESFITRILDAPGKPPSEVQEDIMFVEKAYDGTYVQQWTLHDAFASKFKRDNSDGDSSDITLETITGECSHVTFEILK